MISIVIAVFTAPVSYVVDFLFTQILHAPTADPNKRQESSIVRAGRRLSTTVRRASEASVAAGVRMLAAAQKHRGSFIDKSRERVATILQVNTTLVAPDATVEAHREASVFVQAKLDQIKNDNLQFEQLRQTKRQNSLSQRFIAVQRESSVLNTSSLNKRNESQMTLDEKAYAKFYEFDEDFQAQRSSLEDNEREELDRIWQ